MSLHTLYRPNLLDEFVGNITTVSLLRSTLQDKKRPHVLLFTGPSGCGKTTLARIVAKELGATDTDIIEIDASTDRGIDTSRSIIELASSIPYFSTVRVFIIDECHKTTSTFQNSMLKTLEEPPQHAYFLLCTTEPDKLIPTLVRRCARFSVKKLSQNDIYTLLKRVVAQENLQLADPSILDLIATESDGSPGQALMYLSVVKHAKSFDEASSLLMSSSIQSSDKFRELVNALLNNNTWKQVSSILKSYDVDDYEMLRKSILSYASKVLLSEVNVQAVKILENFSSPFYDGKPQLVLACYKTVKQPVRTTVV